VAYISDTYTRQREAAIDLLETIAPDADAQQAQELVRAFIHTDLPKSRRRRTGARESILNDEGYFKVI
jgi:hypothetical protein